MILNYLGSKARSLPQLDIILNPIIKKCNTQFPKKTIVFADLFAGSGVVNTHYAKHPDIKETIVNDQEIYSFVLNKALQVPYTAKLAKVISYLNSDSLHPIVGLITKHYSPYAECKRMFFTVDNAMRIDAIRVGIHILYARGKLKYKEFLFLLGSLIASVSKYANNTSCFRAYLKSFSYRAKRHFILGPIHTYKTNTHMNLFHTKKHVLCQDTLQCISNVTNLLKDKVSIVYLDPPYTSNHYGSYYGFYNYLCEYKQSKALVGIAGVPADYNKSIFGLKTTAIEAYRKLIKDLACSNVKYIIMSYNEDGVVMKHDLVNIMKLYGSVKCYKLWNRRFKPNKNVEKKVVKEFILVTDLTVIKSEIGKVTECWMT